MRSRSPAASGSAGVDARRSLPGRARHPHDHAAPPPLIRSPPDRAGRRCSDRRRRTPERHHQRDGCGHRQRRGPPRNAPAPAAARRERAARAARSTPAAKQSNEISALEPTLLVVERAEARLALGARRGVGVDGRHPPGPAPRRRVQRRSARSPMCPSVFMSSLASSSGGSSRPASAATAASRLRTVGTERPMRHSDLVQRHLVDEVVDRRLLRLQIQPGQELAGGVAILEQLRAAVALRRAPASRARTAGARGRARRAAR